ncbi:MAG: hypothetical protein ACPGU7_07740 [Gammaproteobacteria bacterium]
MDAVLIAAGTDGGKAFMAIVFLTLAIAISIREALKSRETRIEATPRALTIRRATWSGNETVTIDWPRFIVAEGFQYPFKFTGIVLTIYLRNPAEVRKFSFFRIFTSTNQIAAELNTYWRTHIEGRQARPRFG